MNLNFRILLICFSIAPSFVCANEWSEKAKQDIDEIYSMKVYRNRKRKADESYLPQYVYDGDIWETEKLKKWILTLQEKNRS